MNLGAISRFAAFAIFAAAGISGISPAAAAQDLRQELKKFVETPAVPGYEQVLAKEIQKDLTKWKPKIDTIGNVVVTIGSGSPHRVIVTPMDEPGYIVSNITADGFLRVQRLPQTAPNPIFDSLYSAEPVSIRTRSGKNVTGVVAGLSTHLQGARPAGSPADLHEGMYGLDDIYVDVGATSAAEVRQAGVEILDPISIERHLYEMGYGRMTSPAIGDRFGCAALVEMLLHLDAANVNGTLTVAFVGQQWAGGRGLERILAQAAATQKIDEMIYVGRLTRGFLGGGRGGAAAAQTSDGTVADAGAASTNAADAGRGQDQAARGGRGGRGALVEPKKPDGSGVLIGGNGANATLDDFSKELQDVAVKNDIAASVDTTAALARAADAAAAFPLPARFARLGIATKWPATPGEIIDADDLASLTQLLEVYAGGSADTKPIARATSLIARPAIPAQAKTAPSPEQMVSTLVESYGVGYHEVDVRETVKHFLPPWAKPETDDAGNLWVHLGAASKDSKTPRIAVVAHMDEIGFEVRGIEADGKLQVVSRGGGILEYFIAHTLLVHTANGDVPGVLELPDLWNANGFILRPPAGGAGVGAPTERGPANGGRGGAVVGARYVDVGARSWKEAQQLGIKVGDRVGDYVTIPKKYRPLIGRRATARSFDDRAGCSAAIAAIWELGPQLPGRDVTFIFSTGEELGLLGAAASAKKMAADGRAPDFVFAIDTFVSSDSPLESKRFADTEIGHGFVVRAVDNSDITPRQYADRVVKLAKANNIPVQLGITGGGNDGSVFLPYGTIDIGLGWPLRYSHSPGEVIDTRDLDGLAHILAVLAKSW